MPSYHASERTRQRMRELGQARAAALAPRNAEIRRLYAEMTGQGVKPGAVCRHLGRQFNVTNVRISQIVAMGAQ